MNKIEVTNSAIIINDYHLGDCPKLEFDFKMWDPITHTNYIVGAYYDDSNNRFYIPRGYSVKFVESLLKYPAVRVRDKYKPTNFSDKKVFLKALPRSDVQKQALRFCLGKIEFKSNAKYHQLALNLNTGIGKTFVMIATTMYESVNTIVIASSVSWLNQWMSEFMKYTDTNARMLYNISGSGNINRLLSYDENKLYDHNIFFVTHDTLGSYARNNGWESIGKLFEHLKIGIKIYDEAHLDFANICMIDYFTNVNKTFYVTATFGRSNVNENQIYQRSFRQVPSIDLFNPDEDPHTRYLAMQFKSNPTPEIMSKCKGVYNLDRNKYVNWLVSSMNENFYKVATLAMKVALNKAFRYNEKILIYIGTNDAIKIFKVWLENMFPELVGDIGIFTSIISKEEKEIVKRNRRVILSTTKSAGVALDIKRLKITINMAEPFVSEIIARQSLGRTRDDDTLYIELIDMSFKDCRSYYNRKLPIYNKYALACSNIRLYNGELDRAYDNYIQSRSYIDGDHSAFSFEYGSEYYKKMQE